MVEIIKICEINRPGHSALTIIWSAIYRRHNNISKTLSGIKKVKFIILNENASIGTHLLLNSECPFELNLIHIKRD